MERKTLFKQAVIFAGGRGERLRPLTDHLPKPMAPVNGRPFADYLLKSLADGGIRRVLFLLGYRSEAVISYYDKHSLRSGVEIDYSVGVEADQTGRRLLNAYEKLDSHFLLLYGDNYWPLPLGDMTANYVRLGLPITTTVFSNRQGTGEYGYENNVIVAPDGKVKAYDKTRKLTGLNGVDIGFFLVDKSLVNPDEPGNISFEETILARAAQKAQLGAYVTDEQYYYITSLESLARFEQASLQNGFRPLDRG